jgi:hypothetical protein
MHSYMKKTRQIHPMLLASICLAGRLNVAYAPPVIKCRGFTPTEILKDFPKWLIIQLDRSTREQLILLGFLVNVSA